jgi:hypothetical protein
MGCLPLDLIFISDFEVQMFSLKNIKILKAHMWLVRIINVTFQKDYNANKSF